MGSLAASTMAKTYVLRLEMIVGKVAYLHETVHQFFPILRCPASPSSYSLYLLYTAPLSNKERHCRCYSLDTFNTHPLVKTMNVSSDRSVDHRRDLVVQTVHTSVNVRRRSLRRQLLASGMLMGSPKDILGVAARLKNVALRVEAVPSDLWRVLTQVGIFCSKLCDFLLDLFCC